MLKKHAKKSPSNHELKIKHVKNEMNLYEKRSITNRIIDQQTSSLTDTDQPNDRRNSQ
jgi:hypothetical protein